MDLAVKRKLDLRKEYKKDGSMEAYRLAKKDSMRSVYGAKKTVEKESFGIFSKKRIAEADDRVVVSYKCFKFNNRELEANDSKKHAGEQYESKTMLVVHQHCC